MLKATASFYDRGVATTAADAYVRVAAGDVTGATVVDKNATLALLSRSLVDAATAGGDKHKAKRIERRIRDLRHLADAALGGDPSDDLLSGAGAESYNRMLDRALEALP